MANRASVIFERNAIKIDQVWGVVATHPSGQQETVNRQAASRDMPRKSRELTQATSRAAEARRAVAGQRLLVETLKASGKPSFNAEDVLQMCTRVWTHNLIQ